MKNYILSLVFILIYTNIFSAEAESKAVPVDTDRHDVKTLIAVCLVGHKNKREVLLGKRQNTGQADGLWALVAGHVESGELPSSAMLREAKEEAGLELTKENIKMVGSTCYISSKVNYITYYFLADLTGFECKNMEPEKCEKLQFFPLDALPVPVTPGLKFVVKQSLKGDIWLMEADEESAKHFNK